MSCKKLLARRRGAFHSLSTAIEFCSNFQVEDIFVGRADNGAAQTLRLGMANRHGLVAGATGTGKTVTLQTIAEQFSADGVPVFLADVKGDLSGIAMAGSDSFAHADAIRQRVRDIAPNDFAYRDNPAVCWDLYGEKGHPIRTTVSEMGPLLLSRLLELGDPDKLQLVFFFDEAHWLFDDAPQALFDKIEQGVLLIRSKGVGVYFITQNPIDVPEKIAGQLGNRVQHALRAFTPHDQRAIRAAAETFRINPALDVEAAITQLKVGEALVSMLDADGAPSVVQRYLIAPPRSRLGPVIDLERALVQSRSPFAGKYDLLVNRESAAEVLAQKAQDAVAAAQVVDTQGPVAQRAQPRRSPSIWERAGKAAFGVAAASAGKMIARQMTGRRSNARIGASAVSAAAGAIGTALGGAMLGRFARAARRTVAIDATLVGHY